MIRKTTVWALRALVYLAEQCPDHVALASEVADATGAPLATMSKVLQRLSLAGLVVSLRGVRGGYLLDRTPESVNLGLVLRAMDDPLGLPVEDADGGRAFPGISALLETLRRQAHDCVACLTVADLGLSENRNSAHPAARSE